MQVRAFCVHSKKPEEIGRAKKALSKNYLFLGCFDIFLAKQESKNACANCEKIHFVTEKKRCVHVHAKVRMCEKSIFEVKILVQNALYGIGENVQNAETIVLYNQKNTENAINNAENLDITRLHLLFSA